MNFFFDGPLVVVRQETIVDIYKMGLPNIIYETFVCVFEMLHTVFSMLYYIFTYSTTEKHSPSLFLCATISVADECPQQLPS